MIHYQHSWATGSSGWTSHRMARAAELAVAVLAAVLALALAAHPASSKSATQANLDAIYASRPPLQDVDLQATPVRPDADAYELATPQLFTSAAPLTCWSEPDETTAEVAGARSLGTTPAGTDFILFLIRGTRAYSLDIAGGDHCWIDLTTA